MEKRHLPTQICWQTRPPHLPIYLFTSLFTCPKWSGHASTPFVSTRQPSKVELGPLSIQVRAHINSMVARGMYAHIFHTVLKWTVVRLPDPSLARSLPTEQCFSNSTVHTSPRGPGSLQLWGGDWESAFLTHSGMMTRLLVHGPHFEATQCIWAENEQVRVLPCGHLSSGRRKKGTWGLMKTHSPRVVLKLAWALQSRREA